MATTVEQTYRPAQNMSVTKRNGVLTKVTLWTSGDDATKTVRIV